MRFTSSGNGVPAASALATCWLRSLHRPLYEDETRQKRAICFSPKVTPGASDEGVEEHEGDEQEYAGATRNTRS